MKKARVFVLIALAVMLVLSTNPGFAQGKKINVIATITIIQDIARNVAGDKANVDALVPTNGDVHEFEPTPDDITKIANADVILVNGAGLEQFLDRLIADSGTKGRVITVSQGLPIQQFGSAELKILGISGSYTCGAPQNGREIGNCDPHLWQNVTNVIGYTLNIRDALSAADPTNAEAYNANAGNYIAKLQKLDADIFVTVSSIPPENRVLVTNHDALGYFITRYGFKLSGVVLPGGTTGQEPDPKQVAELIQKIKADKVKAIFLENVSSDKLANQISDEAGVKLVQGLYTDALGDAGSAGATYLDMMYSNLKTLEGALR